MARLGRSSTRAAMIYRHATRDRDAAIAIALGGLWYQLGSDDEQTHREPPPGRSKRGGGAPMAGSKRSSAIHPEFRGLTGTTSRWRPGSSGT